MPDKVRLLFVDDHPEDVARALEALDGAGIASTSLRVGDVAALRAALQGSSWDLMVSECRLPDLSGEDALRLWREAQPSRPCVIFCDRTQAERSLALIGAGAGNVVGKDDLARLVSVVRHELENGSRDCPGAEPFPGAVPAAAPAAAADSAQALRDYEETSSEWRWEMSPDLRFTRLSERYEALSGASPDECLGRPLWEVAVSTGGADETERLRAVLEARTGFRDLAFRYRAQDGSLRFARISGKALLSPDGGFLGYRGTAFNDTEALEAVQEARHAHQALVDALESIPAAIMLFDREERFVMANSRIRELFGEYADKFRPGRPWDEIHRESVYEGVYDIPPGTEEEFFQRTLELFRNPPPFREHRRKDGRWIRAYDRKTSDGGTVMLRFDITDLKEKEAAVLASESKIRSLVENTVQGTLLHRDFKPLFVNSPLAAMFGYPDTAAMLDLKSVLELFHPAERERIQSFRDARLAGREAPDRYEALGLRANGDLIWLEIAGARVDWDGEPALLANILDITERKRREEALRLSEARLKNLIERSDLPLIVHRDFKPLYTNQAYARLFGYASVEEVLALPNLFGTMREEDIVRMRSAYAERMARGSREAASFERRVVRPDGTAVWVEFVGAPVDWDGAPALFVACINVDARKKVEEELAKSEARFRGLIEHTDLPLLITRDFRPLFANQAYARIFGFESREAVMNLPDVFQTMLPEDRPRMQKLQQAGLQRDPGSLQFEREALRADGTRFWVQGLLTQIDWEGEPAVVVIYVDITPLKQAQEELRASQRLLQTVFDTIPAAVTVRDTEGRYIMVNRVEADYHSTTPDEYKGRTTAGVSLGLPEEIADVVKQVQEVLTTGQPVTDREFPLTLPDGRKHYFSATRAPLKDDRGRIQGVVSVSQDVTDARVMRDQLNASQRMEAVGRLAGGVAHDFNNILAVIMSYSGFILDALEDSSELRGDALEIRKAAERAASLTRQLLAFSRKQVQKLEVLDLNLVLANMQKMLGRLIGEDIRLTVRPATGLGSIKADISQIEQVVMNLAVNARDAMPQGGELLIETDNAMLDETFCREHVGAAPGSYVRLSVSDTGTGMTEDVKRRIFEPFFTTKGLGKGTGLGLATVYGIIKQSGGSIWVYSEIGKGTTFKIYLPRTDETGQEQKAAASAADLRGTETILLVEDEERVRMAARRMLEQAGYQLVDAPNGRAGLEVARNFAGHLDLLVTDVIMPELSGRELADQLEKERPDIHVLFMSGYTDDAIVHHGVLEGDVQFLEKPFTRESLLLSVRAALKRPPRRVKG